MGGSDEDEETGLLHTKRTKYFNKVKADEVESFIRSSYYICILLFMLLGVGVAGTIFGGVYKHSPLTENILITIAGPIYLVLFLILLFKKCKDLMDLLRIIRHFELFSSIFFISNEIISIGDLIEDKFSWNLLKVEDILA